VQATGSPLGTGDGPYQSVVADFNNDGDQDIATVTFNSAGVTIDLGGPGASFAAGPPASLPQPGSAIAADDFNDDGDSDLLVPSAAGGAVYTLEGNGDGTFTARTPVTLAGANNIAVVDINSDRSPDIAVLGDDPTPALFDYTVYSFLNNGGFGFSPVPGPTSVGSGLGGGMATGDFDNDGREDLAVGVNDVLWVFRNQASNTLSGSPQFDVDVTMNGLEAGDFDGDGDEDLVTTGAAARILRGSTGTSFAPDAVVGGQPNGASVGDFNSDGDPDLALSYTNPGRPTLAIFTGGTGVGFSQVGPNYEGTGGNNAGDTAVGDFDGDGNQDVVMANFTGDSISIFTGTGNSWNTGNLLGMSGMEGVLGKFNSYPVAPAPWSGTAGFLRYGSRMGPSLAVAQRWEGGSNYISGGFVSGNASYSQTVDVSAFATDIDAKQATANLSARLGGWRDAPDQMSVTATFRAADGTVLGSFTIGPVSATARGNRTLMLRRATSQGIPAQTRSIVVRLDATQPNDNTFRNNASADNVRLFVATPSNPDPTDPGPGGGGGAADTTAPETEIDKAPKRRTEKSKAKIRYSANEPATFQCALKGSKRELRGFTDCGETKAKYKRLKPGKKKFQVRAIDAAGNVDATPAKVKWKVLK
jgi:hypothetical protein